MTATRTNSYPTFCVTCQRRRPEGHGPLFRDGEGRWAVSCSGSQVELEGRVVAGKQASARAEAPAFVPSSYQAAIERALRTTQTHIAITAVAGSGKTTTLAWLLRTMQGQLGKCLFLAFNKSIAEALKERVPASVRVQTLNSFGAAQLRANLRMKPQDPADDKVRRLAVELFPVENHPNAEAHQKLQAPLIQLARLERATLANNPQLLADRYGVDLGEADLGLLWEAVPVLVARCRETALNAGYIDFDDQVWLPATEPAWRVETFDTILIDEMQDLNAAQDRMILRAVGREGRVIGVGDRYQAIYGFRGAGITAFDDFVSSLKATARGCVELPLSVCYRCPQAAEELVNGEGLLTDESGKVTEFLVRDGAPKGEVVRLPEAKLMRALEDEVHRIGSQTVGTGRGAPALPSGELMILCPMNAPLVRPALRLLCDGIKATIRGRDIGQEIIRLIMRVNPGSHGTGRSRKVGQEEVPVMLQALRRHCMKEIEKLMRAEKEAAAEKIADQEMVIQAFAEEADRVTSVVTAIENIFSESEEGVIFSTVHRAKGLEAKTVYILREWLMPFPACKQAWERRQGLNLRYVAFTRFQEKLVFVYDAKHAPDDGEDEEPTEASGETWPDGVRFDRKIRNVPPEEASVLPDINDEFEEATDEDFSDHDDKDAREFEDYAESFAEPDTNEQSVAGTLGAARDAEAELHPEASNVDLDKALLAEVLKKLPSLPTEGEKKGFVSPSMSDWSKLHDLYAKAGCECMFHKPTGRGFTWKQYALDVTLPGVTVRCSTTVEGFGETRESGKNAIDVVVIDKDGRPVGGQKKVLRTDAWQGRVCQRVNALLRQHAKVTE